MLAARQPEIHRAATRAPVRLARPPGSRFPVPARPRPGARPHDQAHGTSGVGVRECGTRAAGTGPCQPYPRIRVVARWGFGVAARWISALACREHQDKAV